MRTVIFEGPASTEKKGNYKQTSSHIFIMYSVLLMAIMKKLICITNNLLTSR